ncbi:hypothetical protein GW755_02570 [bacterium]|nr:hypothetical protein [bacterium]
MLKLLSNLLAQNDENILFEGNSPLSGHLVVKDTYLGRELLIEGTTHTIKSVFKRANYWEYCVEYSSVKDGDKVLVLGLGGGEIIRNLFNKYKVTIEVVELDPAVIAVYKKYFMHFIKKHVSNLKIIEGDALEYVLNSNHKKYDVIIGDVYSNDSYDNRLLEDSFLRTVKSRLTKNGQFISNRIFVFMSKSEIENYTGLLKLYFNTVYSKYVADGIFHSNNYVFFANK